MRHLAIILVATGLFLGVAGGAAADPPPPVANHRHFLILPDGTQLPVGPSICANAESAQGFYGFHQNIHTGTPNTFAFLQPSNPVGFTFLGGCGLS